MRSIRNVPGFLICCCLFFMSFSIAATKTGRNNSNEFKWDRLGYHELNAAPPIVRNIGNILYIGDGHETLARAEGKSCDTLSRNERGDIKENLFGTSNTGAAFADSGWYYCDVAWLWHLHRILVDNGIGHQFAGAEQFYIPRGGYVTLYAHKGGYLAYLRQNSIPYRGIPFSGKALTSYGRRASEISGRTSIYDRYQELPHLPFRPNPRTRGDFLNFFEKEMRLSGELDLDEGNIRHWLGLEKHPHGAFSLAPDETPDIAILRVGLQDLLHDTMKQTRQKTYKLGSKTDFQKATQRLLGNGKKNIPDIKNIKSPRSSRKIHFKRMGDMEIIVTALREKNPNIRILALPLAMYSYELIFRGQYANALLNGKKENFDYIGKTKAGLTALHNELNAYNEKLKAWCGKHGVAYVHIPEVHTTWTGETGNLNTAQSYLTPPSSICFETAHLIAKALGIPGGGTFGFPRKSTQELTPCKNGERPASLQKPSEKGYTLVYRYENIDAEFREVYITPAKIHPGRRNNIVLKWLWKDDVCLGEWHEEYTNNGQQVQSYSPGDAGSNMRLTLTNDYSDSDLKTPLFSSAKQAGRRIYIAYSADGGFAPALSNENFEK